MNRNMIILIILIILVLLNFFFIRSKLYNNEDVVLDDVKLREESSNNGFALMLEQEDGTYKESESNSWPTGMSFNSELSGCIDVDGNKIEDSLSFNSNTNAVIVRTNKTAHCYVYFDISNTLVNYILENADLWNSTLEGDGYRYVGTNPDNYICFGASSKSVCLDNTSDYMYRIIGIFEDEDGNKHAKLIKADAQALDALGTTRWHYDSSSDVLWGNNELVSDYFGQNISSYFPYLFEDSREEDNFWVNKITNWNYVAINTRTNSNSGLDYYNATAQQIYLNELNKNGNTNNNGLYTTYKSQISLMYVSDYMLSLGSDVLQYTSSSNASQLASSWLHCEAGSEWTMSRYGSLDGRYAAWFLYKSGSVNAYYVDNTAYARIVFYLNSDVKLLGGTGSATDPFIIE